VKLSALHTLGDRNPQLP